MKKYIGRLFSKFYPSGAHVNDTVAFYQLLSGLLDASKSIVLNAGAGPTPEPHRRLKGKAKRIVGVDIDPIVLSNTDCDETYQCGRASFPFPDNMFDVVYSDWVLEHVEKPRPFLAEIYRVLKPGGCFLFRTVNRRHYVSLVSRILPQKLRTWILEKTQGRCAPKIYYRVNSESSVRRIFSEMNFCDMQLFFLESPPYYLCFHPLLFLLGVFYERIVNSSDIFNPWRFVILGKVSK